MARGGLAALFLALVLAASLGGTVQPARADPRPLLFGAEELSSTDMRFFPQWTAVLRRQALHPLVWPAVIHQVAAVDILTQLRVVNEAINRVPYVDDVENWGVADRWSDPAEFLAHGGDCEDFAIAKYLALRSLGVPAAQLRIAVVEDRRSGVRHAVLAAYTARGIQVLDNLSDRLIDAARVDYYRPFYSINEDGWWLH